MHSKTPYTHPVAPIFALLAVLLALALYGKNMAARRGITRLPRAGSAP